MQQEPNNKCNHINILDLARSGKWEEAHKLVRQFSDELSCLIHAYLHRVEGKINNAKYWYDYVGTEMPSNNLEEELIHLYEIAKLKHPNDYLKLIHKLSSKRIDS